MTFTNTLVKLIPFVLLLNPAFSQTFSDSTSGKKQFRHEVGIDISNSILLIRKAENMYLLNYKFHFKNHAIRSGLNLNYQTFHDGEKSIDYRLGFEWSRTINKWEVFYGVDVSLSRKQYNYQNNTITKYGINPLIGFRYYFSPHFSISTEPKINIAYIVYRDPDSFSKYGNSEGLNVSLVSIGVILLNFHF
jgi:hypothetical protein